MESRWYLFPGQTLENSNISDREHALHITSKSWGGITKHLDRKKLIQEALDKEKAHRKALKEGSEAMTRNWDNSVENIRRRKEEAREKRTGFKDVDKLQKFYELREEQEKQRDEIVKKVKEEMFHNQGYCRDLNSALLCSEVLYEREKQVEFSEFLKQHEQEEERLYAEKVKLNAEAEKRENAEKEKKLEEEKKALGEILRKEMKEMDEMKKAQKHRKDKREAEDNVLAAKELENIKRITEVEKAKKKREMKEQQLNALERRRRDREMKEREDKEMEDVVDLYAKTKHRIECIRKQKEREMQEAFLERVQAVSKLLNVEEKPKELSGENLLEKMLIEREKADIERFEHDKKERLEDTKQCLEMKELERQRDEELTKWEMLNRYKVDIMSKEHDKERKSKAWQNTLRYRKELLRQIEEEKNQKKQEEELLRQEYEATLEALKAEDKLFFSYADEVNDTAEKRGRPTYPIQKVVLQYKKDHNMLPKNGRHICEKRKPGKKCEKIWENEKHMSLLKEGYLKCKCCKKYVKE